MDTPNILLVEDDLKVNELIKEALTKENYNIDSAFNGEEALVKFSQNNYELIILDLMLPIINGEEVLRQVREKSKIPVLILSAKSDPIDKILGLGIGADDYMTKPFIVAELVARVKSQLRRYLIFSKPDIWEDNLLERGNLQLNMDNYQVTKKGKVINLTLKEFEILKLLMFNPNKVFTKSQIYRSVWEDSYLSDKSTIIVHIRRLREKIEDNPSSPIYVKTIWGIGYKFGGEE
ncbi:response regulator transcription factor [Clostridium tetanomorphum]|uniref:Stage 0 sporulation protein A homolog n=1 Tax=Clostridium tetanomorphum TaxID=1553 RepID=A0A923E8E4_CLOTT|nr:response regulator transcription factor [Clostridium tetanomorphum]MBC2396329.1 response regulator transcription factor [Clostridium tetanomorphum]NRZ96739.1 DNA-binding response OmpR family regulator [Clostridium tetanomorphum]